MQFTIRKINPKSFESKKITLPYINL